MAISESAETSLLDQRRSGDLNNRIIDNQRYKREPQPQRILTNQDVLDGGGERIKPPQDSTKMDYGWLEESRDPIATDTNLAEIDFENFRNEDLAYAFSCEEEESASSTDMSICRSEVLFSSMRDSSAGGSGGAGTGGVRYAAAANIAAFAAANSEMANKDIRRDRNVSGNRLIKYANNTSGAGGSASAGDVTQDSLVGIEAVGDEEAADQFNYKEHVKVNKKNYTLTFGGQNSSLYESMTQSGGRFNEAAIPTTVFLRRDGSKSGLDSSGGSLNGGNGTKTMTTWSNLGSKQKTDSYNQKQLQRGAREENSLNNNNDEDDSKAVMSTSSGMTKEGKKKPVITPGTEAKLVNAFIKSKGLVSPMDSDNYYNNPAEGDDNQFIERNEQDQDSLAAGGGGDFVDIPMMKSKDTVNQFLKSSSAVPRPQQLKHLRSIEETEKDTNTANSSSESNSAASTQPPTVAGTPKVYPHRLRPASMTNPHVSAARKKSYPELDFLENDLGLWDTFFHHSKNASKFHSVLNTSGLNARGRSGERTPGAKASTPQLPLGDYMRNRAQSTPKLMDEESLLTLLPNSSKHLVYSSDSNSNKATPISQVCMSLSQLRVRDSVTANRSQDRKNEAIRTLFMNQRPSAAEETETQVQKVTVKEAWTDGPTGVVMRHRGRDRQPPVSAKRRSYNPNEFASFAAGGGGQQDIPTSKSMSTPVREVAPVLKQRMQRRRAKDFPKSGSQNDICDTRTPEDDINPEFEDGNQDIVTPRTRRRLEGISAEYPFHVNISQPHQGISFDLTRKRGLFVNVYHAVERLLMYQEESSASGIASSTSARCILFHELSPALYAVLNDGLKPEVITSFGKMETSVWRVIEALSRQGPSTDQSTCDLVMLINTKFSTFGEDERKFAGFIAGLVNMSSLHIWFSKLKWSMDVLLRFYERHSFIVALHKETRLLFDELLFCLQRLYSVPVRFDLPFSSDLLNQVPSAAFYASRRNQEERRMNTQQQGMETSFTGTCASCGGTTSFSSDGSKTVTTPSSEYASCRMRKGSSRSRIPRPISLPKRLEEKFQRWTGITPGSQTSSQTSPPTTTTISRSSSRHQSMCNQSLPDGGGTKAKTPSSEDRRRTPSGSARKSRTRDMVKIFDAKSPRPPIGPRSRARTAGSIGSRTNAKGIKSPNIKTGAGEAMAGLDQQ